MKHLILLAHRLLNDRRGITAIEYAVLAGGVSVALIAVFSTGDGIFGPLQDKLTAIINGIPTGGAE